MAPLERHCNTAIEGEAPSAILKEAVGDDWQPKTLDPTVLTDGEMQSFIENAEEGLFFVKLGESAPFDEIGHLLEMIHDRPELMNRLNAAYTKNLVYKDSFGVGQGGAGVDQKRVLDLSAQRLALIRAYDDKILTDLGPTFEHVTNFWNSLGDVSKRLLKALGAATGQAGLYESESSVRTNLRLVDYYARAANSEAPRCGEHRDFGQMTIIFPSTNGLQIFLNNSWRQVPMPPAGVAVCLLGIVSSWRSNDRLASPKHRVDPSMTGRRISAVLFHGPGEDETLAPIVKEGEHPKWISGVVKDVRPMVARKWKGREGTVTREEALAEEDLKKFLPTQDDAIDYHYKIKPQ